MRARICQPLSRIRMRIRIPVNRTTIVKVRCAPAGARAWSGGRALEYDFGLNIILPQCLVLFKLYLIVHCEQW